MKKVVLIDGNNLMFRSFYATFNQTNIMKNSQGMPTNALYGFATMINKIIFEEKPSYVCVAFDVGKNFRKEKYSFYKEGRQSTPSELKLQMPYARRILEGMGIKYLELEPYEADDIIGTLVKMALNDKDFDSTIISSDKDLLQLINYETDVKLLKKDSFIRFNEKSFKEEYHIDPLKIIDLKALMGDSSDNIPGVKGIGEKTALKLLQDYHSLEGIYENIDLIKGSLHEKLVNEKDMAYMSKEIATIYQDVPLNISFEDLKYEGNNLKLQKIYEELEFYSLLKKIDIQRQKDLPSGKTALEEDKISLDDEVSIYMEMDNENYHLANIIGLSISDDHNTYYFNKDLISKGLTLLTNKKVNGYDLKRYLKYLPNSIINNDLMIIKYLINETCKDDISYIMQEDGLNPIFYSEIKKNNYNEEDLKNSSLSKSKYIHDYLNKYLDKLKEKELFPLYEKTELPLVKVLFEMEEFGMKCKKDVLEEKKIAIKKDIDNLSNEIYSLVGMNFNISSPLQLGDILFEKLALPGGKKNKRGYVTDASTLEKLIGVHPVIEKILLYRNLSKLYSTYLEGLEVYIDKNEIIRPIFKQTLTRTGRLSCTEPNLQNIPVKDELGKSIRLAFVPQEDVYLSADYSQIELRILAHISQDANLINAFKNDEDIHRHVAADIYSKKEEDITKSERKTAKAVIFGIVYGISGFGLGENLNINPKEAQKFINKYYELYPGVKNYMDNIIKEAKEKGYVLTLLGHKRVIDELNSSNFMVKKAGERMALNTPIQGTSADIIKMAMVNINHRLEEAKMKSKMVLQIHDELIFDTKEEELTKLKEIVIKEMENVIKLDVPLKVEVEVGKSWYEI